VLVELRGFEPLTSAMRTHAAPFSRTSYNQQGPRSAQVTHGAQWHHVGPRELPQALVLAICWQPHTPLACLRRDGRSHACKGSPSELATSRSNKRPR
jgi:hypothetical protein